MALKEIHQDPWKLGKINSFSCEQWHTIIYNNLKIFSQNVRKNSLIVNIILETQLHFNIIFIQEPLWSILHMIPSSISCEEEVLVGTPHHSNWLTFAKTSTNQLNSPRVLAYINIRLSSFYFSLHKDLINHKNILFISLFNNNICFYIMKIYSDTSHSALKYLKDTEASINNLLIMTSNFNIRDSLWDSSFSYHSSISDNLIIIADSFNLELLIPTNSVSTRYSNTAGKVNSVIDLMFLQSGSIKLNNHLIYPDLHLTLDHAPLTVSIPIAKENINSSKLSMSKNSEEEITFVNEVMTIIKNLNTCNLMVLWS